MDNFNLNFISDLPIFLIFGVALYIIDLLALRDWFISYTA